MSHSMTGSELQDPGSDLRDSLGREAERMGCGLLVLFGSALPAQIQERAKAAFSRFEEDPGHHGLQFKQRA